MKYGRGHKGQGMTEYAVILVLVVIVGVGVHESSGVSGAIDFLYGAIVSKLSATVGYDTDKTFTIKNRGTTETWHETILSYSGGTSYFKGPMGMFTKLSKMVVPILRSNYIQEVHQI